MLQTTDDLIDLVRRYDAVALMGNSEGVDIDAITARLPENTLYVFFTGCAKILKKPFRHDAILCHRVIRDGQDFLKSRRTFDSAYSLFPGTLKGEVAVIADDGEPDAAPIRTLARTSPLLPVTLDFDHVLGRLYPAGSTPTTGFAVAMWLLASAPEPQLWLCGFTGVAGTQFKLFAGHDWTFEQTALQLLSRTGRLRRQEDDSSGVDRFVRRFPEFDRADVSLVYAGVLAKQLTSMDRRITHLWTLTKIPRSVQTLYTRFRRKFLQR